MTTDTNNQRTDSGFFNSLGGFLNRLLLAFLKLAAVFIILVVLAAAAWFIFRWLNNSFDSVASRTETNRGRIDQTTDDLQTLKAANIEQEEQIEALQDSLATLEAGVTGEGERRDELFDLLEEQVTVLIDSTDTISGNVTLLNEGLLGLQSDITTNVSDIDGLGGQVDGLLVDLSALSVIVEGTQTELGSFSAEEFDRMRHSLIAFRAWESISRARLRLLEGNAGLSTVDIEAASQALEELVETVSGDEETTAALEQVQNRLTLAALNLPDDPAAATRDLETAWEALDRILASLLGVSIAPASEAAATPTPTTE